MATKQLPLTVVDGKDFTWTRKRDGVMGVADRSDLPEHLGSRVYADAADFGFMIKGGCSTRLFTHVQTLKDNEGEVVAEVFRCTTLPHVEVHVLND